MKPAAYYKTDATALLHHFIQRLPTTPCSQVEHDFQLERDFLQGQDVLTPGDGDEASGGASLRACQPRAAGNKAHHLKTALRLPTQQDNEEN